MGTRVVGVALGLLRRPLLNKDLCRVEKGERKGRGREGSKPSPTEDLVLGIWTISSEAP